jgi:hypothetical protein
VPIRILIKIFNKGFHPKPYSEHFVRAVEIQDVLVVIWKAAEGANIWNGLCF